MTVRISSSLLLCALASAAQSGSTVEGRVLSTARISPVGKVLVTMRADVLARAPAGHYSGYERRAKRRPGFGRWICESQADGRYKLSGAFRPATTPSAPAGPRYLTQPPGRFATAADFPPVKVQNGQERHHVDLRLTPTAAVAYRVVDIDGDPVRGGQWN